MMHRALHELPRAAPFLKELLRLLRAQGPSTAWDGKDDAEILAPFLLPKGRRESSGEEPDPDVFWRIEIFHDAVGLAIEARTGVVCTTMLKMQHEGFGRLVLLAGRLVVVSRFLRDAHRFGFESVERLADAGEKLVAGGESMIERFPEAARYAQ
jgi:probable nitrogen fixation protein